MLCESESECESGVRVSVRLCVMCVYVWSMYGVYGVCMLIIHTRSVERGAPKSVPQAVPVGGRHGVLVLLEPLLAP